MTSQFGWESSPESQVLGGTPKPRVKRGMTDANSHCQTSSAYAAITCHLPTHLGTGVSDNLGRIVPSRE